MKFLKIALTTAAIAGLASTAAAQDTGAYINIGVDAVEFDAYTLSGKLGYNINDYFGVEGQAGFGISDFKAAGFKTGVDSTFAGFGVARFPVAESFEIFARGGYHFTQFSVIGNGVDFSADTDGFAVGAGGQFFFTANDGVRAEYTYQEITTGSNFIGGGDIFSLSYVRNF